MQLIHRTRPIEIDEGAKIAKHDAVQEEVNITLNEGLDADEWTALAVAGLPAAFILGMIFVGYIAG